MDADLDTPLVSEFCRYGRIALRPRDKADREPNSAARAAGKSHLAVAELG